ncbi:PadR family transcriptional regulator [Streptomyces sp. NPDC058947]|uniref:PadR family transcriptional regulator n=1 Tax=Streptomyces sp. NPDC058947 TaxID=3346675 RepID=UPI0036C42C1F
MNGQEVQDVRLTKATILVLEKLLIRPEGEPVWALEICRSADLDPGTVYPILARLHERNWVSSEDEDGEHPGRPPRRLYQFTKAGRRKAVSALLDRQSRLRDIGVR